MNRRISSLLLSLVLLLGLATGCGSVQAMPSDDLQWEASEVFAEEATPAAEDQTVASSQEEVPEEAAEQEEVAEPEEATGILEEGSYSTPEEVALYLHTYGHLPENYITKNEAKALGWDSSLGNLWEVAPGKSIGGDRFGNYEGLLPEGSYRECDVNYQGGFRGAQRLIYGEDGSIYFTEDHYQTFTQLYGEEIP